MQLIRTNMCQQIQFLLDPDPDLAGYLAGYLHQAGYPSTSGSGAPLVQAQILPQICYSNSVYDETRYSKIMLFKYFFKSIFF